MSEQKLLISKLCRQAQAAQKQKKPEQAKKIYKEALKKDPNCLQALMNLGLIYSDSGKK